MCNTNVLHYFCLYFTNTALIPYSFYMYYTNPFYIYTYFPMILCWCCCIDYTKTILLHVLF